MGKFEPKQPVELAPPNYSPMSVEKLEESNGMDSSVQRFSLSCHKPRVIYGSNILPSPQAYVYLRSPQSPLLPRTNAPSIGTDGKPCYVAIKGIIFDVSGKEMYQPGGAYSGKDNPFGANPFSSAIC